MMRLNFSIKIVMVGVFFFASCSLLRVQKSDWEILVDQDLTNWDVYLSYQHKVGYNGLKPKDENGKEIPPIGLNKKGYDVFTTIKMDGSTVIRNTGAYYGCLITKKEYENYHFQLKYKWGKQKWAYRKNLLKDSGILYHSIGPMGVEYWRSWMLSQEFQIMEGHTGDFWSQANSAISIRAYKGEGNLNPVAHETQEFLPFSMTSVNGNYCMRSNNYEKPSSEWNTLDLYCYKDKSIHMVNGKVVMILKNSSYTTKEGRSIPLTKGKIQLQSEAAEVFFKDVRIRPIHKLPLEKDALFYHY